MEVLNVKRPILSAGRLAKGGFKIVLDENGGYVEKNGRRLHVDLAANNVFVIKGKLANTKTVKFEKAVCEVLEEDPVKQDVVEPKGPRIPERPSEEEVRSHSLTHTPHKDWCEVCLQSRGVDDQHRRADADKVAAREGVDHIPLVEMDYAYFRVKDTEDAVTVRTMYDVKTGWAQCSVVDQKGRSEYGVVSGATFLREVGYPKVRLRTDAENPIQLHSKDIASRSGKQLLEENAVRAKHSGIGSVEAWHKIIKGIFRAQVLEWEKRFGAKVSAKDSVIPRLVRHAGWIYNHYHVLRSGATPFKQLKGVG